METRCLLQKLRSGHPLPFSSRANCHVTTSHVISAVTVANTTEPDFTLFKSNLGNAQRWSSVSPPVAVLQARISLEPETLPGWRFGCPRGRTTAFCFFHLLGQRAVPLRGGVALIPVCLVKSHSANSVLWVGHLLHSPHASYCPLPTHTD